MPQVIFKCPIWLVHFAFDLTCEHLMVERSGYRDASQRCGADIPSMSAMESEADCPLSKPNLYAAIRRNTSTVRATSAAVL